MEAEKSETSNKDKYPPLSKIEREILIELIKDHSKILENKKTSKFFNNAKDSAWKVVTEEFNSNPEVCKRDTKNLRKSWDNLKARSKKEFAAERSSLFKTGGGQKTDIQVSDDSVKVHDIVKGQIDSLANSFDDDSIVPDGQSDVECSLIKSVAGKSDDQELPSDEEEFNNKRLNQKTRKRKQSLEELLIKDEETEHQLRCEKIKAEIQCLHKVKDQKLKILQLKEKYWEEKIGKLDDD